MFTYACMYFNDSTLNMLLEYFFLIIIIDNQKKKKLSSHAYLQRHYLSSTVEKDLSHQFLSIILFLSLFQVNKWNQKTETCWLVPS